MLGRFCYDSEVVFTSWVACTELLDWRQCLAFPGSSLIVGGHR